jgi:hypothetical protein
MNKHNLVNTLTFNYLGNLTIFNNSKIPGAARKKIEENYFPNEIHCEKN